MPRNGGILLNFHCTGVSHRDAGADVRDVVAFSPDAALRFREALAAEGVAQSAVLSTCNRCEVFYWGGDDAKGTAERLFTAEFPSVDVSKVMKTRSGVDALTYLFRIAAGLESMILGEYQILGQVKDAHAAALASGHAGRELDRILRDAVTCAKKVKTELDIGAVPPSVCRAGMEIVDKMCGIAGRRVFVIGSGRTGTLAAKFARRRGASSISVCNRSPERARRLEEEVGAKVVDYALRHETAAESDIVVSATASPHTILHADQLRLAHPVMFLDLASPRDVDPAVAGNPLARLVSIDTIGELAAGDRLERERLTERGMEIVASSVDAILRWLRSGTGERRDEDVRR